MCNVVVYELTDPSLGPGVTPPVNIPPPPPVLNVTACCITKRVQKSCLDVCSFDIDSDMLITKPSCLPDVSKMVQCAAGRLYTRLEI